MIYKMTWKGQIENLTSGQGHDLTRKGNDAYQSIRLDGSNSKLVLGPVSHFNQNLLQKNC